MRSCGPVADLRCKLKVATCLPRAVPMLQLFTETIWVVSDPVCKVVEPVIEGRDATLMCRMLYLWQATGRQFAAPPGIGVSLSWDSLPGTTVTTTADPGTFVGSLETNTTIQVMSDTIPSYTCTIRFDFSAGSDPLYQYAVNSVSSACVTEPTTVLGKFKVHRRRHGTKSGYAECEMVEARRVESVGRSWKGQQEFETLNPPVRGPRGVV